MIFPMDSSQKSIYCTDQDTMTYSIQIDFNVDKWTELSERGRENRQLQQQEWSSCIVDEAKRKLQK